MIIFSFLIILLTNFNIVLVNEHILLRDASKPQHTGRHTKQEESSKLGLEATLKKKYFLTQVIYKKHLNFKKN